MKVGSHVLTPRQRAWLGARHARRYYQRGLCTIVRSEVTACASHARESPIPVAMTRRVFRARQKGERADMTVRLHSLSDFFSVEDCLD